MILGVDTGGTFTDFVLLQGSAIRFHKVLSTPDHPVRAILQGIRDLEIDLQDVNIVHGTTVATNAVLEGKGARTVYITNRGLKDILTIGRQNRKELYNLTPLKTNPPVPPSHCLETGGRITAQNEIIDPLTPDDIAQIIDQLTRLDPESVAINFLFSYVNGEFENRLAEALPEKYFVTCSSNLLPEYREYERGMTTWLNAYVGPIMQGYLGDLEQQVSPARLSVMRSSGQTCRADQAGQEAVHMLLSGPAGGLCGAQAIGRLTGHERILTFDMGGTSTDVAMIDGTISISNRGTIGNYPVSIPQVDIYTIGAGGGSIARVDQGGVLLVGPESAGADPGPACYARGGILPTVTDANVVLGYLPYQIKLGGHLPLDYEKAFSAVSSLVTPLGNITPEAAADGIIKMANEHMVQALRVISVERGIDPRACTLVSFGGAGGLHACALAEALDIKHIISPAQAGVLSALGMLVSPAGRQLARTLACSLNEITEQQIISEIETLTCTGRKTLVDEGIQNADIVTTASLDLCYQGQAYFLNIPWHDLKQTEKMFHAQHQKIYGHQLDSPVELVNVRVVVTAARGNFTLPWVQTEKRDDLTFSKVYGIKKPVPVLARIHFDLEEQISGPAIIVDEVSTLFVAPRWQVKIDKYANLILSMKND